MASSGDEERRRAQPFLVHIAGERRHYTELPGVSDGAVCFMPRASLTGVELAGPGELVFTDIGLPPRPERPDVATAAQRPHHG